ncbi:MAG: NDP-sugar synthase [Dehalococcoidia bacterium]
MAESLHRAVVLSAGYGTRLGALTAETPKPMLDIAGQPLIERILRHLAAEGVDEVGVNLHFRPEQIRDRLRDGAAVGLRIRYTEEAALQGTAGGVRGFASWLREDAAPFLVQYGDVLTDQPLAPLLEAHRAARALVTIVVHRRAGSNSVVERDEDGRVTRFLERPADPAATAAEGWVNSGIYVCAPEVLERIPPDGPADFPRDVFPALVEERRLFAVPLTGYRCAIDSAERLEEARAAVRSGRLRAADAPPGKAQG